MNTNHQKHQHTTAKLMTCAVVAQNGNRAGGTRLDKQIHSDPCLLQSSLSKMKLLTTREVISTTSLSRSSIHRKIKDGTFPKPIAITKQRRAWRQSDIEQWINDGVEASQREVQA